MWPQNPLVLRAVWSLGASTLYLIQLAMSARWLRTFRLGPAEWAWRSLTYGSLQPLRRSTAVEPPGGSSRLVERSG